ncbi:hypothetical protein GIB67_014144 [Kingdonia uniflora]|uniref:Uncharacterized protein n=1 Tax=Kingdonia uniflora TaxID=39325 RepID=A0A7J7N4I2_9MAGN|nr:hypothetical protein GIB67_014144 [Kingdonia uniflora]
MSAAKSPIPSNKDSIYVAAMPLRASKGPPQMLMSLAFSLNLRDLQHYMVIIKPYSSAPQTQVHVFDFQPQIPENASVALSALSGKRVPGVIMLRKLSKLPERKCWLVGITKVDGIDRAKIFNERWDTALKIGEHDCRDYTNGLVEHLTGEKRVLERLRGTNVN